MSNPNTQTNSQGNEQRPPNSNILDILVLNQSKGRMESPSPHNRSQLSGSG